MKSNANKLIIVKNGHFVDEYRMFTYTFKWYLDDEIIMQETRKIDIDEQGLPIERYSIDELVNHKIDCCLDIDKDNFTVEEVIV
jgi:hypothetical protein